MMNRAMVCRQALPMEEKFQAEGANRVVSQEEDVRRKEGRQGECHRSEKCKKLCPPSEQPVPLSLTGNDFLRQKLRCLPLSAVAVGITHVLAAAPARDRRRTDLIRVASPQAQIGAELPKETRAIHE